MASNYDNNNSVKIIPFCISLPSSSSLVVSTVDDSATLSSVDSGFGIVGTITLRGQSAVVWFGWGAIEPGEAECCIDERKGISYAGNGKPPMGSLALSMPPVTQNGRQILHGVPTTQLLGGSSEEDMIHGAQISSRLAKRVGWPVFVSCSLSGWGDDSHGSSNSGGGQEGANAMSSPAMSAGYDDSMQQHAAAMAEREVSRILLNEKEKNLIS